MSQVNRDIPSDMPPNNGGQLIITSDSFEAMKHDGEESQPQAVWYRHNREVIARHASPAQVEAKKREIETSCGQPVNRGLIVWAISRSDGTVDLLTDTELRNHYDVGTQHSFDKSRPVNQIFRAIHIRHSFEFEHRDGRREHKPANTVVMKYDDGTISFMPWAEFRFTVTPWDRQNRRPLRERGKENGALPRVDQEGLDQLWAKFNQGLGQKTK